MAGRLSYFGREIIFDHTNGAFTTGNNTPFPGIPENIIAGSPMSLWNLALEIHTGRFLFPLTGNFYILYIPLIGISTLVLLVTGFTIWWKEKRKQSNCSEKTA